MNRDDFRELSRLRLREAKVLLDNQCYEGAYYLMGYAVECALKACIAKHIRRYDFPEKKIVKDVFTHNLETLVRLAGLETQLKNQTSLNPLFADSWETMKDWSEESRYKPFIAAQDAAALYTAATHRRNGVLTWLKKYW
jgi:hypothetical protein